MGLRPGKGFRVHLNDVLAETLEHLEQVEKIIEEFGAEAVSSELMNALLQNGWEQDDDRYGEKAFHDVPMSNGEVLRISIVKSKPSGEYKLDVRTWFNE